MAKLHELLQKLGLDASNGLYYINDPSWTNLPFSSRIKRLLENKKLSPDAFFCFANKPLILFFENPKNKDEVHKSVWNFNESPIVIIVENSSIEIFNGFKLSREYRGLLDKIGGNEKLDDFSYFKLVTGQTWQNYQDEFSYKNRIDYKLLSEIREARKLILDKFPETEDAEIEKQNIRITNALLGKIIFIRYLIDRKVELKFDNNSKIWTNDDFCDLLGRPNDVKRFFDCLADPEDGFNGDLFPLIHDEYKKIPKDAYAIIIRLLKSEDIATGQRSLFDLYDFSIIPIEFISNIYESFIGIENQAKEGAYYTPLFLVDYILSETIDKALERDPVNDYKVLDPSCGSGVFLVEFLRKLIEQHIANNMTHNKNKFKEDIKGIAEKNIFGVDRDESAVQVAIFSVYLTLLDYMEPPEISSFKFPRLLNTNFFCDDFFDQDADFNQKLKNIDFSFIIGNPPWKRGKDEKKKTNQEPLYVKYIRDRKRREKAQGEPFIEIGNKETAQAFLLRVSDFSKETTKCALIVTSKVLYNLQSIGFRKYFLHYYQIDRVFELAPVRRMVFDKSNDKSVAPASVLFFKYANGVETDSNIIEHITVKPSRFFSLFKIFVINRNDIQTVQQNRLKEFDWLWKVLVYGSYLDFNFIKRLKNDYPTIKEIIQKDPNLVIGQGVMVGGGDENDASWLMNKRRLDTRTDIRQFWINPDSTKTWQQNIVHRVRNKKLYKAPMLLITGGNNSELKCISALNLSDLVFKSSLTAIKLSNIDTLRQIAGILNSSFFSYYNIQIFSSTCIEREETHDKEKLDLPFPKTNKIHIIVQEIEDILKEEYNQRTALKNYLSQDRLSEKIIDLEKCICDAFSITKSEQSLLDYINSVVIPVQMKHKGHEKVFLPCGLEDTILVDYAQLFLDRFKSKFIAVGKKLVIEIWYSRQIIGMFFTIISEVEYKQDIIWVNKQNDETGILKTIISLGATKVTDQLFVQKDIRGFEKECFYIFKPNEKRLWHKAIGYLDVNEFADAILKAGRDNRE